MKLLVNCPRLVFSGDRSDPCGCAIEVEVEIPKLSLVTSADSAEVPVECFYKHRFDAEEVADLRSQINAEVERLENVEPTEVFEFPEIVDPFMDGAA